MATAPSLFGANPEDIQQRRDAALNEEALQYAQLDPFQRATMGIYRGASQLGGAIGGMLGGTDPQMQRASQRQQMLQGLNPNDPASLKQGIERAMSANDYPAAQEFATRLQDLQAKLASTSKDVAAAGRERQAAIPADIQKAELEAQLRQGIRALEGDESPEGFAKKQTLTDKLDALTRTKEPTMSETGRLLAEQAALDPVKDKAKYDVYTARIAQLTAPKKSIGAEIGEGLGILGKALGPALKEEGKTEGGFAAKDYNTLGSAVAAGTASKRNVRILKDNLETAFTGSLSDTKKNISSALIGLGLPIGSDIKDAVSATQLVDAMGTRYVFPLIKNFPGALAAKELDRLEKTAPNTLQQPETIKRLISLLEADLAENEFTYGKAKKYKETNKSVIGFNQADQKIEFQQKYGQLQDLVSAVRAKKSQTSSEAAQINALRKELGL